MARLQFGFGFILVLIIQPPTLCYNTEVVSFYIPSSVIDTAKRYINVVESGNNNGKEINKFLNSVSLAPGNPYCQAFIYYCMSQNGIKDFKTGLANGYYSSMKNKYGFTKKEVLNKYGIVVWKYPNSNSGHIGFLLNREGNTPYIHTLEANTSFDDSSPDGRIYKGKQGIFRKRRRLDTKLGGMSLRGIIQK